jgi:hypothetical protein
MCTFVKNIRFYKSKYPKYVLAIKSVYGNEIKSIYMKTLWQIGKKYTAKGKLSKEKINANLNRITNGAFHVAPCTIESFNVLKRSIEENEFVNDGENTIFLCEIPKDIIYIYGINYRCSRLLDGAKSICTKRLKLIKPINSFNEIKE